MEAAPPGPPAPAGQLVERAAARGRPAPGPRERPWRPGAGCGRRSADAAIVATKIDKLARGQRIRAMRELESVFERFRAAGLGGHGRRTGRTVETDRQAGEQPPTQPRSSRSSPPKGQRRRAPRKNRAHRPRDAQGHERRRAHEDRQAARRAGRDRHAQAGADLRDPEGARREERPDLLGGRARDAARRLRLPAGARLQLPARARRHLRLARRRFASSTCTRATRCRARFGRRRTASATSR